MYLKLIASAAFAGLVLVSPIRAQDATIPKQTVNEQLRARLPENIRAEGKLISVNMVRFLPMRLLPAPT